MKTNGLVCLVLGAACLLLAVISIAMQLPVHASVQWAGVCLAGTGYLLTSPRRPR